MFHAAGSAYFIMTGESLPSILDGLDAEARFATDAYDPEADSETSADAGDEIANRCRNAKAARASRNSQQPSSNPVEQPWNETITGTPKAAAEEAQEQKRKEERMRTERLMSGDRLDKFNFSDDFQDLILACMVRHPHKFTLEGEVIAPKLFNGPAAYDAAYEFREWLKEHKTFPDFTILGNLVYQRYAMRNPDRAKECVEYVKKLSRLDTSNADGVRGMVAAFAKERAVQNALRVAMDASYQGKEVEGGLVKLFDDALAVGTNLNEELAACLFNPGLNPPEVQPVYSLCDIPICTPGNLTVINAKEKSGKSSLIGAMLASNFTGPDTLADTLGFASSNPNGLAVLHVDTEQTPNDHWHLVDRAMRRAGVERLPDWVQSYCLTRFGSLEKRKAAVWHLIKTVAQEYCGIHSVLIDGVADLVNNVNDPEESNNFVAELHAMAIEHDCPIIGVIHQNTTGTNGKTRGHLGSQLSRKSETNLRLDKDDDGTIEVWSDKQRRAPIPQGKVRFAWSDEAGMHVTVEPGTSPKEIASRAEAIRQRDEVFADEAEMLRCDLLKEVQKMTGKSESTAKRTLNEWVKLDIVQKNSASLYIPKD
jgi:hypothetical protein